MNRLALPPVSCLSLLDDDNDDDDETNKYARHPIHRVGVLPYYCLSWVLTWCSHDITDFPKVARLFDFFLASNPLMPVYFSAAVSVTVCAFDVRGRNQTHASQPCAGCFVASSAPVGTGAG